LIVACGWTDKNKAKTKDYGALFERFFYGDHMIHIHPTATSVNDSAALYQNVLADGVLSWSSETADGYAANALGPQTYDAWVPSALPATLTVTLVAAAECDTAAIIGHTLGSSGATVLVEWLDGATWQTASTVTPEDDRDIVMLFGAEDAAGWRIRITGTTAPAIGVAMIGKRFAIPGGVAAGYVPLNLALDIELSPSSTVTGQYVGTFVKRSGGGTTIPLLDQNRQWIEDDARELIAHYNAGRPFIWMGCPEILPEDMAYCWRSGGSLTASYGAGAVYGSLKMQVSSYHG
jgi:hypothetical protein